MHLVRNIILCALVILPYRAVVAGDVLAIRGATIETAGEQGRIDNATLLVRDGKIEAIGQDVSIPIAAKIIEAGGKTIIPGIVDPYYTVPIGRSSQPTETRTVVFQGRVFNIGGGSPAVSTAFAKVASGINLEDINWRPAVRSGITTAQLAAAGYCQSAVASLSAELPNIFQADGDILVSVTNDSQSLDVLRNGLREPRSGSSSAAASTRTDVWKPIRDGQRPLFVNVNNAAAILHTLSATKESSKVKVVFIASGADIYRVIDQLDAKQHTVVIPPRVETIPNSQNLINVPKMLAEAKIPFMFSTSLGQSEFRAQQDAPLFAVGLLVRGGLPSEQALAGLTLGPAKLLGLDKELGSLETGKQANFIVLDNVPFGVSTGVCSVYVEGKPIYESQ